MKAYGLELNPEELPVGHKGLAGYVGETKIVFSNHEGVISPLWAECWPGVSYFPDRTHYPATQEEFDSFVRGFQRWKGASAFTEVEG
jgi:hypothetical protein